MRTFIRGNQKTPQSAKEQILEQKQKLMTANFPYCTPEHNVQHAAEIMSKYDCGAVAVVETEENLQPIGVITARDIVWRVVAKGKSPGTNDRARRYVEPPVTEFQKNPSDAK